MPIYKKDIQYIVPAGLAQSMIEGAGNSRDMLLVALAYLTGARPSEILLLRRSDIWSEKDAMHIKLHTLKLRKGTFFPHERELKLPLNNEFVMLVADILQPMAGDGMLFNIGLRRVEQIFEKLSDNRLCPYNFRHTRMTKLARVGATVDELMFWKGAANLQSVAPYLRGKPIGRIIELD